MSAPVLALEGVSRRYGRTTVLDAVTLHLDGPRIHGLLGRNGAGKSTLVRLACGLDLPDGGTVRVLGEAPFENRRVLDRLCTVTESQRYPDAYTVAHVLAAAGARYPRWDEAFARELADDFDLPCGRPVRKLSRGMRSALGVVVGLASRAELTVLDEPYLGLDAVARRMFYDRLLADFAEHPRTVLVTTHLIDEIAPLLEHVVLLDRGRVLLDADTDELLTAGVAVQGPAATVADAVRGLPTLRDEHLAGIRRVTVVAPEFDVDDARSVGLTVHPLSLQELVVATSTAARHEDGARAVVEEVRR